MSKDMWIADIDSHIAVLHKHEDSSISLVLLYGDEKYYLPIGDVLKEIAKSYARIVIAQKMDEKGRKE